MISTDGLALLATIGAIVVIGLTGCAYCLWISEVDGWKRFHSWSTRERPLWILTPNRTAVRLVEVQEGKKTYFLVEMYFKPWPRVCFTYDTCYNEAEANKAFNHAIWMRDNAAMAVRAKAAKTQTTIREG